MFVCNLEIQSRHFWVHIITYHMYDRISQKKYLIVLLSWNRSATFWRSDILGRPQNFAKFPPYFWLALHRAKVSWTFRKILWPSQNTWTLMVISWSKSFWIMVWYSFWSCIFIFSQSSGFFKKNLPSRNIWTV